VFEFAHPLAFLALPLPLLAALLLPPAAGATGALRVPFFPSLVEAAGIKAAGPGGGPWRPAVPQVVAILVWTCVVTGFAGPERIGEPITRTEANRDIMLAIDLSGSMDYRDFPDDAGRPGSRFAGVQRVVTRFVAERESDRIGLIVFGDKAYLQLPFTRDLATATDLVALMEVGMAGPRTALGDAIGLSIHAFGSSDVEDRILVLLTDGSDTASQMTPLNAAAIAQGEGIQIYTIGLGSEEASGEDRVDFEVLEQIARRTGGRFYRAADQEGLTEIYGLIDAASRAEGRTDSWRPRESLLHWPCAIALLVILAGVATLSRRELRPGASS